MTREEQIRSAAFEASTRNDDYKKYAKDGIARMFFVEGAMFAESNQPSPWISVEERLPDRLPAKFANWSKEVFVAVKRGRECRAYVDKYSHIYKTWGVFGDEVTHWMPIPELPKEELL
jgi:hypothetical protein